MELAMRDPPGPLAGYDDDRSIRDARQLKHLLSCRYFFDEVRETWKVGVN